MKLEPGMRFGPYEILAPIGAGAMGEAFRARDVRLARDVALKLLPEAIEDDPERLARFEREAKLLAQLNHPNIAAIHGVEDQGSVRALVMELVEGPTLAERLEQGSLPLDECLSIAREIAEALEQAHEKGIVHRDLKPNNIKTPIDEKTKVLDFGLAKALDPAGPSGSSTSAPSSSPVAISSPTLTTAPTQLGTILGTAAYMSPEQARGRAVDKRSDIWAFGCVLWEMLTGRRLFEGETVSDTLAAVLTREPDWNGLPAKLPGSLRQLLRRCLERDPKRRLRDIGEARVVLEDLEHGGLAAEPSAATTPKPRRRLLPWVAGALIAGGLMAWPLSQFVRGRSPTAAALVLPASFRQLTLQSGGEHEPALSPDGRRIALAGQEHAYLLDLEATTAAGSTQMLRGPEADQVFNPASWSPDGRSIVGEFWGGGVRRGVVLCSVPDGRFRWITTEIGGQMQSVFVAGGRRLIWSDRQSLRLHDLGSGETRELLRVPTRREAQSPTVSADGRWLAFLEESDESDIWMVTLPSGASAAQ